MRNLEHQNGVLLAKYQAVMSMKDRRGPEGAQVTRTSQERPRLACPPLSVTPTALPAPRPARAP